MDGGAITTIFQKPELDCFHSIFSINLGSDPQNLGGLPVTANVKINPIENNLFIVVQRKYSYQMKSILYVKWIYIFVLLSESHFSAAPPGSLRLAAIHYQSVVSIIRVFIQNSKSNNWGCVIIFNVSPSNYIWAFEWRRPGTGASGHSVMRPPAHREHTRNLLIKPNLFIVIKY